jgi:hypothetical protein
MRRRRAIRTVFVYALLGAVATVLSSWAIHGVDHLQRGNAPASPWIDAPGRVRSIDRAAWDRYRPAATWADGVPTTAPLPMRECLASGIVSDRTFTVAASYPAREGQDLGMLEFLSISRMGLPARSMRVGSFFAVDTGRSDGQGIYTTAPLSWRGGLSLGGSGKPIFEGLDRFALPLEPIWPGFAINAVAWGMALFVVMRGGALARGAIRRRRGRCPMCGYDRAGLGVGAACPECGRAATA